MLGSVICIMVLGLNYGIDFKGGTTIRTESPTAFDVGEYRQALEGLDLGDIAITEVFDPSFGTTKHVAMIRIGSTDQTASVTPEQLNQVEAALKKVDPQVSFAAVESVGPKVSSELINTAFYAVGRPAWGSWPISGCALNGSSRWGHRVADPRRAADGGHVLAVPDEVRPDHHRGDPDHGRLLVQ